MRDRERILTNLEAIYRESYERAKSEDLPGRSLLPLAAGRSTTEPVTTYFEALSGQLARGWAPLYGVVEAGRKYVDTVHFRIPARLDLPRRVC